MTEVVLFDIDGVVLVQHPYFSFRLAKLNGFDPSITTSFFENEFQECLVGKRDLKQELRKVIPAWGVRMSVDELLAFWFDGEAEKDKRIIQRIHDLREKGIRVFAATNQEEYRTRYFEEHLGFNNIFDGIFSSARMGIKKPDPAFWKKAYTEIGIRDTSRVFLVDDDKKNIQSAREFGLQTHLYTDFEKFKNVIY